MQSDCDPQRTLPEDSEAEYRSKERGIGVCEPGYAGIRSVQDSERHRGQRDSACRTHGAGQQLQRQASQEQFLGGRTYE